MPSYRDIHGRVWHVDGGASTRARGGASTRRAARRASTASTSGVAIGAKRKVPVGPGRDVEVDTDKLAAWLRKLADTALLPIELVDHLLRKLGGLPGAIIVGGALYVITREDGGRGRRRRS